MKDLSDYIQSITEDLIPNSVVRVHLKDGVYYICMNVYDIRYMSETVTNMIKEFIDSTLKSYFPKGLENKKIVNVFSEEYE
jgi:hypothetical protein